MVFDTRNYSGIRTLQAYHEHEAARDTGTGTEGDQPRPDPVDHPPHYNQHPAGIECIAVVEAFNFNLGNAIKYIWRAGLKPGTDAAEDLRKAAWYVAREIERRGEAGK